MCPTQGRSRYKVRLLISTCAMALLYSGSARAQSGGAEPASARVGDTATTHAPEEIIVTAQKRSEKLRNVPISITALTGRSLAKQGITSPADLAKVVPGLNYQKSSFGVPVFALRGIGLYDTSVGISPTVSIYIDQVPIPYLAMTRGAGFDVERVEVLKGPQGTLFGQNSTGGAINYIDVKPTRALSGGFDLNYGTFNEVDAQGFVSVPVTDTLRVRAAIRQEYQDGWQYSQTRPGNTMGARDFKVGHVIADWDATPDLTVELNANGWIDHSQNQASQFLAFVPSRSVADGGYPQAQQVLGHLAPAPDNARAADWDPGLDFRRHDWMYQISGRGDWRVNDHVTLTSITSYNEFRESSPVDTDGTSFDDFRDLIDASVRSLSQELRAAIDLGRFKVTTGGNFEDDHTAESQKSNFLGSNSGIGPYRYFDVDSIANQSVRSYAGFASLDAPITQTITATAGVRYTQQYRDFQGCLADGGDGELARAFTLLPTSVGLPYNPAPAGGCVTYNPATLMRLPVVTDKLDQNNVSWRTGLNWKPTSDMLIYANVTRGFKSGAFEPLPAVFSTEFKPATQEMVTAYETGIKASVLPGVLDVESALFYYDYVNKQVLGVVQFPEFGALPELVNIPKSQVAGFEIDATLRPVTGLRMMAGITYADSHVDGTDPSFDPLGRPINLAGEAFPNAPRWQANVDAEYDFPLSSRVNAFVGGNVFYRAVTQSAFGDNPLFVLKSYTTLDLRAGLGWDHDRWQLEFWGHNVTNAFYWSNVSYYIDSVSRTAAMPATFGATLRARF